MTRHEGRAADWYRQEVDRLTEREKVLLDCAAALVGMAQEIEKAEGMAAGEAVVPQAMRWAYRLGQASGYRYASEAVTETLTRPTPHLRGVS